MVVGNSLENSWAALMSGKCNASVPDFQMSDAEFLSRLGHDCRITVRAASQKGSEREMMKQGWSEGLTGCNMSDLKDFSPFAV